MDTPIVHPLKRCSKCGIEKPATIEFFHRERTRSDGFYPSCKVCKALADRAYREKHYPRIRERQRRWEKDNVEHVRQYKLQWAHNNRHRLRKKQATYRITNREHLRTYHREWSRRTGSGQLASQKRLTLKRALPNTLSRSDWQTCLDYFHGCCAYCGAQRDFWNVLEIEHVIPVNSPDCPGTVAGNIIPACCYCNSSKRDSDVMTWLTDRFGKRKAKQILKRIQDYFASLNNVEE